MTFYSFTIWRYVQSQESYKQKHTKMHIQNTQKVKLNQRKFTVEHIKIKQKLNKYTTKHMKVKLNPKIHTLKHIKVQLN